MDDLFPLLLFVIFFVAPLIEQIRKKNQQQRPPLPPPDQPTLPPARSSTEEVTARPRDAAEAMIPDDLWKILTGEARPPVVVMEEKPRPAPASKKRAWDVVYIPPEQTDDEEQNARDDVTVEVRRTSREAVQLEHARRHKPAEVRSLEVEPTIVSLETPLPSAAERHDAFHKKIAAAATTPARKRGAFAMTDRRELQRAFVMQEIFGRPRGLD